MNDPLQRSDCCIFDPASFYTFLLLFNPLLLAGHKRLCLNMYDIFLSPGTKGLQQTFS